MKTYLSLFLGTSVLLCGAAFGQPYLNTLPPDRPLTKADLEKILGDQTSSLKRFNLEFPGGTPAELVKAMEKAGDQPINTIIPEEYANQKLPAFTLKNVTAAQVFEALQHATAKFERYAWTDYLNPNREPQTGSPVSFYFNWDFACGFKTDGTPGTNSIWSFYCNQPQIQHDPKISRFYQLGPYLEAGYKVEDITSSIQTAWKMLGVVQPPDIFYHKDTKLLIAVGDAGNLKTIDDVLKQLPKKSKGNSNDSAADKSKSP
jgi:hypothetical protein